MKILVTGFDPFGGEIVNPSYEAVKRLPDVIVGANIIKVELPTVMNKSIEIVNEIVQNQQIDVVINVGQAGGRKGITPEKVAINLNDFKIKDNEGNQPIDEKIYENGENAYFSTLPVKAIVKKLHENNIAASVSYSAGTFVCNHLMYGVLHNIHKQNLNVRAGFVHIPFMDTQVKDNKTASMSLETMVEGLKLLIESVISSEEDIKYVTGKIS